MCLSRSLLGRAIQTCPFPRVTDGSAFLCPDHDFGTIIKLESVNLLKLFGASQMTDLSGSMPAKFQN